MFPSVEEVRKAVEKAVREGLGASSGTWCAQVGTQEVCFIAGEFIDVLVTDENAPEDEEMEREYHFRVVVIEQLEPPEIVDPNDHRLD